MRRQSPDLSGRRHRFGLIVSVSLKVRSKAPSPLRSAGALQMPRPVRDGGISLWRQRSLLRRECWPPKRQSASLRRNQSIKGMGDLCLGARCAGPGNNHWRRGSSGCGKSEDLIRLSGNRRGKRRNYCRGGASASRDGGDAWGSGTGASGAGSHDRRPGPSRCCPGISDCYPSETTFSLGMSQTNERERFSYRNEPNIRRNGRRANRN